MDDTRGVLEQERQATLDRLAALTDDFDSLVAASHGNNADDEHDPEGATIAFERSQLDALVQQARRHLIEIDAASARLTGGTYGACELCGRPIPEDRLRARPTARTCVNCGASGGRTRSHQGLP
jgi:DnaK suppressor protein